MATDRRSRIFSQHVPAVIDSKVVPHGIIDTQLRPLIAVLCITPPLKQRVNPQLIKRCEKGSE